MEPTRHELRVDGDSKGERVDRWLAARLPDLTRSRLRAMIQAGDVRIDGASARPSARLKAGQTVTVTVPPPTPAEPAAQPLPLRIVHEDARLLVVDKPAGMVVHPGAGRLDGTLVNALLHHIRDLSGIGGVLRPGIVHRLDKGTSGLIVVAKDDATHQWLSHQFAERKVEKHYEAIVLGVPRARSGTVDAAIGRHPRHRHKMTLVESGRAARSSYQLTEALDGAAHLAVRIETGRTHQIRVHLASLGHPVVGDETYGGARTPVTRRVAARRALEGFERPALHAARLAFRHPETRDILSLTAPLPEDMAKLIRALRPPIE